jgi:phage FluMu protein Com
MPESQRTIPKASGQRQPLKVNAFEAAKSACSKLLPLFPYVGPDAIVPALGVSFQEEGRPMGRFFHENSVDEVGMCLGAGGGGDAWPGGIFSTGRTHPVGQADTDPEPEIGSFGVITIIQRHGIDEQRESFTVRCSKCQHLLLRHRYSFVPSAPDDGELEEFATLVECANGAEEYNSSEDRRTCTKCGHVNEIFPLENWGWRTYRTNAQAAEAARRALVEASSRIAGGAA